MLFYDTIIGFSPAEVWNKFPKKILTLGRYGASMKLMQKDCNLENKNHKEKETKL